VKGAYGSIRIESICSTQSTLHCSPSSVSNRLRSSASKAELVNQVHHHSGISAAVTYEDASSPASMSSNTSCKTGVIYHGSALDL
jgi:hypothetical protein